MESCRFVVLRSPRGRLGSELDMGSRLHRMRERFHRWIPMRTGAQLPRGLHHDPPKFWIQSSLGSTRKLDAAEASAAAREASAAARDAQSAGKMNTMRRKLDAAEASAAALTAALVECRVAAADEHLHRMRAEQTEAPTALLDCSFASRRRASGLIPG